MRLFRRGINAVKPPKVLGLGNCQVKAIAQCAAVALNIEPAYVHPSKVKEDPELLGKVLAESQLVFVQQLESRQRVRELASSIGRPDLPILVAPLFHFAGFHPDVAYGAPAGERPDLPMGNAFSALLLAAWRERLSEQETIGLFRDEVYDELGYYKMFGLAEAALKAQCAKVDIDAEPLLTRWMKQGTFVYLPLHPKLHVLSDIAMTLLRKHQLYSGPFSPDGVDDELSRNLVWPVYPEIAQRLGVAGSYVFKPKNMRNVPREHLNPMDLESFVVRTFACFRQTEPIYSAFQRLSDPRLENLRRFHRSRTRLSYANPYSGLSDRHWWSKAVAGPSMEDVDPVAKAKFIITKNDRVATAGSCFAQHISRRLAEAGFNYLVTEKAPPECPNPLAHDYGVFTARYGNIYTVRQLLQLADRAYGAFTPAIDAWAVPGGFVDPFRPRIGDGPVASVEELRASRETHFAATREMFETADVFVLTLGLTECWRSAEDEAVVPLPPGAVGASVAATTYVPHNFSVGEVLRDLQTLVDLFKQRNPGVRILLTVSPVPLVATHGSQHVLEATTYSKSVLRVAASEIASAHDHVAYFPSYEIVTGSFNRGRYFADDLRHVTEAGVDHVMKIFLRHYAPSGAQSAAASDLTARFEAETSTALEIVCDEEELEQRLNGSDA